MQSLAAAAKLLERCDSATNAVPVLVQLGFEDAPIPLSFPWLERLGLPADIANPHLVCGPGSLRALIIECRPGREPRAELELAARALGLNPSLLWVVVTVDQSADGISIAAVDVSGPRVRVSALVTHRSRIMDSDAETLCALSATRCESDVLTHYRWLEILGRDTVSRRFFKVLEAKVKQLASTLAPPIAPSDAREMALLCVSRLLFLSFLETKGWLDGDHGFLANQYAECMLSGGNYHRRVLAPLFFGTLNTPPGSRAARARDFGRVPFLNGGLFGRSTVERLNRSSHFPDDSLGDLFGDLLCRFRFTAREDSRSWSEAGIDPEMLGKAFEGLMSSADRKRSGAFYTPQTLVREVTETGLSHALAASGVSSDCVMAALRGEPISDRPRTQLMEAVLRARVLDPACGSGAFLVHGLEELSRLRVALSDPRPLHAIRRDVLTSSIFGVDINPMAVWLCELRLWLSMAIEDPTPDAMRVIPLPNLDRNIRVGDSLLGDDFSAPRISWGGARLARLRARYVRATGARKRSLARGLDAAERAIALANCDRRIERLCSERRELLASARTRDLFGQRSGPAGDVRSQLLRLRHALRQTRAEAGRLRAGSALPFCFASGFADVAARGGFDLVIGNPPWIRTHNMDRQSRVELRRAFRVYRSSAWRGGSDAASAGKGFSSQVDSSALFVERAVELLRPGAIAALIVPSKLWRSLAGGGVRAFLQSRTEIVALHDLSAATAVFDAAVYPSVIVARHSRCPAAHDFDALSHRGGKAQRWLAPSDRLPFDESAGSPWLMVPDAVRESFEAVRRAGVPLAQGPLGRPLLGVKTGCNDAFLVSVSAQGRSHATVEVTSVAGATPIEHAMLRPVIRGEHVTPWTIRPHGSAIIWTHDDNGTALSALPLHAGRWLARWRRALEARTDARDRRRWWSVFRVDAASASQPRVIWSDIGRSPRAAVLPAGDHSVPLNTCYAVRCRRIRDAYALAVLLNSDVIAAWLELLAEPARGGYRRYLGWTMALLPLPADWERAVEILAPLGEKAVGGEAPDAARMHASVLCAYRLSDDAIRPLMKWTE